MCISFLSCRHLKELVMAMRWLLLLPLLLTAGPALAQPASDPDNTPPVLSDPPAVVQNAVPSSVVNAGQATVSPAESSPQKSTPLACDAINPCAEPTPAAR
jgi:hypothetical protein